MFYKKSLNSVDANNLDAVADEKVPLASNQPNGLNVALKEPTKTVQASKSEFTPVANSRFKVIAPLIRRYRLLLVASSTALVVGFMPSLLYSLGI
jgi:YbbR domain-containing protein